MAQIKMKWGLSGFVFGRVSSGLAGWAADLFAGTLATAGDVIAFERCRDQPLIEVLLGDADNALKAGPFSVTRKGARRSAATGAITFRLRLIVPPVTDSMEIARRDPAYLLRRASIAYREVIEVVRTASGW